MTPYCTMITVVVQGFIMKREILILTLLVPIFLLGQEYSTSAQKQNYTQITKMYQQKIKPIFRKKCFACHMSTTKENSLYFVLSKGATSNVDMVQDFPFESHMTPLNNLKAILHSVEKGVMPPPYYEEMLSEDETKTLKEWLNKSIQVLEENRS